MRFPAASACLLLLVCYGCTPDASDAATRPQAEAPPDGPLGEALRLVDAGNYAEARAELQQALTNDPTAVEIRHALVRLIAAAPVDGVRDGRRAMQLAQPLMQPQMPAQHLAAAAMVAAENDMFEQARQLQRSAIDSARRDGRSDLLPVLERHLGLYASQQKCREPWTAADFRAGAPLNEPDGTPIEERIAAMQREADPALNPYLNTQRVASLSKRIESASAAEKNSLLFERAWELLRAGRTSDALSEVSGLVSGLEAAGLSDNAPDLQRVRELLAVAWLRKGEQDNCQARHGPESCLLPIRDSGLHTDPTGSRNAIEQLTRLLKAQPENLSYRWLLNLAWMTLDGYPDKVPTQWRIPPSAFASDHALPRFSNIATLAGVDQDGLAGGVAMEDFDGDGYLDLAVSSWGLADPLRFFRNKGDGTFVDRSKEAGFGPQLGGLNLIQADYDNDGDVDLLVLRGAWLSTEGRHPNSLLRNDGDGSFTDVTRAAGLFRTAPTQAAGWVDYDLDGWLDLFIANESAPGDPQYCELHRNNGDGTFTDVAPRLGLGNLGFVKAVAWGDIDNDGWPDLYLSRYLQPNLLLRNIARSNGRAFEDITSRAGVAEPRFSFPAWFWDYDNDGWLDLFVASFADFWGDSLEQVVADYLGDSDGERARLYRNNHDGTFTDVSGSAGLDDVLLAMGANYGDLDNDGWLDAYIGTGLPRMTTLVPNRMYRNAGDGTFQDVTTAGGFGHLQKGHGIAFGDIDNDGDQDIYAVMGGAFEGDTFANALFLNPGNDAHWITLRLEGRTANRSAIGARIRVEVETPAGPRTIHALAGSGGSFGASSLQQEIGLGDATSIRKLEVVWPTSPPHVQTLSNPKLDRVIVVREDPT